MRDHSSRETAPHGYADGPDPRRPGSTGIAKIQAERPRGGPGIRLRRLGLGLTLSMALMGGMLVNAGAAVAAPTCDPSVETPSNTFPGKVTAAMNFENEKLSPFNVTTKGDGTIGVASGISHTGGCAVHIHATTAASSSAKMSARLPAGATEVFADGWFNITKEGVKGNNVPYFRFFNGGTRRVDVFRANVTGDLWLRTAPATGPFIYTRLARNVDLGKWHHLAMHVVPNGTSSGVQIWFDGKSVFAKNDVNVGASVLTNVQLGAEHARQMGDSYIDDVIVKTGTGAPRAIPGKDGGPNTPGSGGGTGVVPASASSSIQTLAAATAFLGTSTSPITCGIAKGGCYQNYQRGAIVWSPATGAHVSIGGIRAAWAAQGYENGFLGYPTTNEVCGLRAGGCYQNYERGAIIWSPATGARLSIGGIRAAWAAQGYENGFLGYPTTNEVCGLRAGGCYQNYERGAIIWSPATGAFLSIGGIRAVWAGQGYENGALGYPTSNEYSLGGGSVAQNYQGGRIVWSPATGGGIG